MKKLLNFTKLLIITLVAVLTLSACGETEVGVSTTDISEELEATEASPTPEITPEPVPTDPPPAQLNIDMASIIGKSTGYLLDHYADDICMSYTFTTINNEDVYHLDLGKNNGMLEFHSNLYWEEVVSRRYKGTASDKIFNILLWPASTPDPTITIDGIPSTISFYDLATLLDEYPNDYNYNVIENYLPPVQSIDPNSDTPLPDLSFIMIYSDQYTTCFTWSDQKKTESADDVEISLNDWGFG